MTSEVKSGIILKISKRRTSAVPNHRAAVWDSRWFSPAYAWACESPTGLANVTAIREWQSLPCHHFGASVARQIAFLKETLGLVLSMFDGWMFLVTQVWPSDSSRTESTVNTGRTWSTWCFSSSGFGFPLFRHRIKSYGETKKCTPAPPRVSCDYFHLQHVTHRPHRTDRCITHTQNCNINPSMMISDAHSETMWCIKSEARRSERADG